MWVLVKSRHMRRLLHCETLLKSGFFVGCGQFSVFRWSPRLGNPCKVLGSCGSCSVLSTLVISEIMKCFLSSELFVDPGQVSTSCCSRDSEIPTSSALFVDLVRFSAFWKRETFTHVRMLPLTGVRAELDMEVGPCATGCLSMRMFCRVKMKGARNDCFGTGCAARNPRHLSPLNWLQMQHTYN